MLALLDSLQAEAQQEFCICHADSCDVFELRHVGSLSFAGGCFSLGHMQPYGVERIDSIVFSRPCLNVTELGWWGDLQEGASRYEARYDDDLLAYTYHVSYRLTAHNGFCTTAECVLLFSSDDQRQAFMDSYILSPAAPDGDPYIYVKETLTGPRRFELWEMGGPLLPKETLVTVGSEASSMIPSGIIISLTDLLAGRPMSDVRLIIEGWLYNPLVQIENPNYHPN